MYKCPLQYLFYLSNKITLIADSLKNQNTVARYTLWYTQQFPNTFCRLISMYVWKRNPKSSEILIYSSIHFYKNELFSIEN